MLRYKFHLKTDRVGPEFVVSMAHVHCLENQPHGTCANFPMCNCEAVAHRDPLQRDMFVASLGREGFLGVVFKSANLD